MWDDMQKKLNIVITGGNRGIGFGLLKILSDKIKLNKLGNQAKERALQRFSWNVVIEKYLSILKINSY